jgi:hypothetical protein
MQYHDSFQPRLQHTIQYVEVESSRVPARYVDLYVYPSYPPKYSKDLANYIYTLGVQSSGVRVCLVLAPVLSHYGGMQLSALIN